MGIVLPANDYFFIIAYYLLKASNNLCNKLKVVKAPTHEYQPKIFEVKKI